MKVGLPDLIAFLCLFTTGLCGLIVSTMQYIAIGINNYGKDNSSLVIECYHTANNEKNSTCQEIEDTIVVQLAELNESINLMKGIISPFSVIVIGGLSDAIGKRFPIINIALLSLCWSTTCLINSFFIDSFPVDAYLFQNGVLLSLCGGSQFTIISFLIAYVSVTTSVHKQTERFGILYGVGFLGLIVGPLAGGLILRYTTKYFTIAIAGVIFSVSSCIIAIILPRVDDTSILQEERFIFKRIILSVKFQVQNIMDLFKYQAYLGKFFAATMMYLLTSVGLATPLMLIPTVFLYGKPFSWSDANRGYFISGEGLLLGLQLILTLKILTTCKMTRPGIVRFGVFLGFVGSFFLAFASNNGILLTGSAIITFTIVASPTILSIVLSLVEPEQIGIAMGIMAALHNIAESGLINIILFVQTKTQKIMNGFCFFTLSFFLGIDLVIAMFYQHPQVTREDRNTLETDEEYAGPIVPSSDVLKGGVPKSSTSVGERALQRNLSEDVLQE